MKPGYIEQVAIKLPSGFILWSWDDMYFVKWHEETVIFRHAFGKERIFLDWLEPLTHSRKGGLCNTAECSEVAYCCILLEMLKSSIKALFTAQWQNCSIAVYYWTEVSCMNIHHYDRLFPFLHVMFTSSYASKISCSSMREMSSAWHFFILTSFCGSVIDSVLSLSAYGFT